MTRSPGPVGPFVPAPSPPPPPSAPTRRHRALATRHALLVAAGERFASAGYHATSLSDLLEHSTISRGALYFHFSSKHDLAVAVVDAMSDSWSEVVPAVRRRAADPLDALVLLADVVIARFDSPIVRGAARLLADEILTSPTLDEVTLAWEQESTALLLDARARGLLRPEACPRWAARTVSAALAGRRALLGTRPDGSLWDEMNDFWAGFLPVVAAADWWRAWGADGWRARARPDFAGDRPAAP